MNNDAKLKTKPDGVLIIVGTPIGNSMDLSARGIEAFVNADFVTAGDTLTCMWTGSAWVVLASHAAAADTGVAEVSDD